MRRERKTQETLQRETARQREFEPKRAKTLPPKKPYSARAAKKHILRALPHKKKNECDSGRVFAAKKHDEQLRWEEEEEL